MRRAMVFTNSFMAGISTIKNTVPMISMDAGIPGLILTTSSMPSIQIRMSIVLDIQFLCRALPGLVASLFNIRSRNTYVAGNT